MQQIQKHKIEIVIPITEYKLFNIEFFRQALNLTGMYPSLKYTMDNKEIKVFGELDNYWFRKFETAEIFYKNYLKELESNYD